MSNTRQQINEGLKYKELDGMMKPTIFIDEFSSKMGDDADIIVLSFFVRDKMAAKDLMTWFERGYDWVLDADVSPGEIKPNRYLVYVEMRRRNAAAQQVQELLEDLSTLTEYSADDWVLHYKDQHAPWNIETFSKMIPLTPKDYARVNDNKDLNEMRIAAGLDPKTQFKLDRDLRALQAAAGI